MLAPFGVPVTWEVYAANFIGASDRRMVQHFAAMCEPPADSEALFALYPRKQQLFQERMAEAPPFVPGLAEFIRDLAMRYKLGVVSSSGRGEIEPLLEKAGILGHFDTLVCGDDVQRHKPAPDPYLLAAERLGIRRALVVEDSIPGMESARAAGFEAVQITDPARMMEILHGRLNGDFTARPSGN